MRVNLHTLDKDLQDLMLKEYWGVIKDDDYFVDKSPKTKIKFHFYNLDYDKLTAFLDAHNCRDEYIYEIRDSETEDLVERNNPSRQWIPRWCWRVVMN